MDSKYQKFRWINFTVILLLVISCGSKRNVSESVLYSGIWELDYLMGAGSQLNRLFESELPFFEFDKEDQRVFGSTGCNGYNAGFNLEAFSLNFGEPGPSTLMYCGEGEKLFKNTMKKVNRFSISEDGKLFLYEDKTPLMRFKKRANE